MKTSLRWYFIALAFVLLSSGCAKKTHDDSAETVEEIVEADTANLDASASAEALPTIDGEQGTLPNDTSAGNTADTPSDESNVTVTDNGTVNIAQPAPKVQNDEPTSVAGTGEMGSYSVQKGDTLMKIAFNVYGDIARWKDVYDWNKDSLKQASQLRTGMTLKYDKPVSEPVIEKNGDPYEIKNGDTLGSIADDIYAKRSKWKKLWQNNKTLIRDPNKIYAGFYLYYQITEQERQQADEIRAKRGGNQLGSTPQQPADAGQKTAESAGGSDADTGGLNSLVEPTTQNTAGNYNRAPAAAKQ